MKFGGHCLEVVDNGQGKVPRSCHSSSSALVDSSRWLVINLDQRDEHDQIGIVITFAQRTHLLRFSDSLRSLPVASRCTNLTASGQANPPPFYLTTLS
jgi:hypothetical protein